MPGGPNRCVETYQGPDATKPLRLDGNWKSIFIMDKIFKGLFWQYKQYKSNHGLISSIYKLQMQNASWNISSMLTVQETRWSISSQTVSSAFLFFSLSNSPTAASRWSCEYPSILSEYFTKTAQISWYQCPLFVWRSCTLQINYFMSNLRTFFA